MNLLLYTQRLTPRADYIIRFIFQDILGVCIRITSSFTEAKSHTGVLIAYSKTKVKEEDIHIVPHNLLIEDAIVRQTIKTFRWRDEIAFFKTSDEADIPFDIFAASFYLVSRYEEYFSLNLDYHGRFPSEESLAVKEGFWDRPVVDTWAYLLAEVIKSKYPGFNPAPRTFKYINTIDIDNAYAFRFKGTMRAILGTLLSLVTFRFNEFYHRIRVYLRLENDPYDIYDKLFSTLGHKHETIWFIQVGKYGLYDKNIPIGHPAMQKLVVELGKRYRVGIHPSYNSGLNQERVRTEIAALVNILNREITCSRQHFIKLKLPFTYRNLVLMGITEDYSMGYTDISGFRASTCTPFKFYDLKDERTLNIWVVPFQTMDYSLFSGMKLTPAQAIDNVKMLIDRVRAVNGVFVTVWHNDYFSGFGSFKGWGKVLPAVLEHVNTLNDENQAD